MVRPPKIHLLKHEHFERSLGNNWNPSTFLFQKHWEFKYLFDGIQKMLVFKFMHLLEIIQNIGNQCTFLFQRPWEFKYPIEWISEEYISMSEMKMNIRMIK